ncbi:MAG: hypothetical protein ACD_48C00348G0001 [uncultured bacterium]|nr:MAG: hypothetical protein ACD_48C00348G0001 [uncultured bacterium]
MKFFEYIFGSNGSYSSDMKSLSREQIHLFVSQYQIQTLSIHEEKAIEDALDHARQQGKISLRKIDSTLQSLVSTRTISINDKQGVFAVFRQYFES